MATKSLYDFCIENEDMKYLLDEWDYKKNTLIPSGVTSKSHKEVWWICKEGHSWKARIESRANKVGCPYCSGLYAIKGESDLATTHPELAKQWHPTKNGNLTATNSKAGSEKKVWWKCENGHEFKSKITDRANKKHNCPYCSNKKVWIGFNDLATTNPELVKEWHPTKNGNLKPTDVIAGSRKKAWWICENKHEWETEIRYRAKLKTGCPHCLKLKK